MRDWLGEEIAVGDAVIYAAASGRSNTMVLARVVSLNESGSVTVKPLKASRWTQHRGRSWYIDKRTGKKIDPWSEKGEHIKEPAYWIDERTGERCARDPYGNVRATKYVSTQFHDYVEEVHAATEKVTLTVTENITKWHGTVED